MKCYGERTKRDAGDIIIQICDAEDIRILKGVVGKDQIHMHIEYPPSKSINDIVKKLKRQSSRRLHEEFKELSKKYWMPL